jgi:hypothetical protein
VLLSIPRACGGCRTAGCASGLTRAARVKIRIYRRRKVVARRTVSGKKGLNSVRLSRLLTRGLRYVRGQANTGDDAVATNDLEPLVGSLLPSKVSRNAVSADSDYICEGDRQAPAWGRPMTPKQGGTRSSLSGVTDSVS